MKKYIIHFMLVLITICFVFSCGEDDAPGISLNQSPEYFDILSPPAGIESVSVTPTLKWQIAKGFKSDEVMYSIYLDVDDATTLLANNIVNTNYRLTEPLEHNTTYSWKVVGEDESGSRVETGVNTFTTNGVPNTFSLLSPSDGQKGVPLLPSFTWSESIDPERNVVVYELYLDEEDADELIADSFTQNNYTISDSLRPETTYQWKVIATDGDGGRTETSLSTFTTGLHGDWKEISSTSGLFPIRQHTSLVYDDNIWTIGGKSYDILEVGDNVYKSEDGMSWDEVTTSAAFPERLLHASAVFDNKMWVIGGSSNGMLADLNDVWYSEDGITWIDAQATGLPQMMEHSALVYENKIWIFHNTGIYNSINGTDWTEVESISFPEIVGNRALVYNDQMWLIGGREPGSDFVNKNWYSANGTNWTEVETSDPFYPRVLHSVAVFDNKMWVIGGYDSSSEPLNDTWYSDDGENWYEILSNEKVFSARFYHTTVVFNEGLWTIGGMNNVERLDTESALDDVWNFQKKGVR